MFMIFINFIIYSIVSYFNALASLNINNTLIGTIPLPDLGFKILPHIPSMIPNIILILICLYFALKYFRKSYLSHLNKLLICLSILFFIRLFSFLVTFVPPTIPNCDVDHCEYIKWNVFKSLYMDGDNTCLDYMFSGHASYMTLIYLFIMTFSSDLLEKIGASIFYPFAILSIIAGHIHYSVDVVIGISLSVLTFYNLFR